MTRTTFPSLPVPPRGIRHRVGSPFWSHAGPAEGLRPLRFTLASNRMSVLTRVQRLTVIGSNRIGASSPSGSVRGAVYVEDNIHFSLQAGELTVGVLEVGDFPVRGWALKQRVLRDPHPVGHDVIDCEIRRGPEVAGRRSQYTKRLAAHRVIGWLTEFRCGREGIYHSLPRRLPFRHRWAAVIAACGEQRQHQAGEGECAEEWVLDHQRRIPPGTATVVRGNPLRPR